MNDLVKITGYLAMRSSVPLKKLLSKANGKLLLHNFFLFLTSLIFFSCSQKKKLQSPLFKTLDSKTTGIDFSNKLTPTPQFNLFSYT